MPVIKIGVREFREQIAHFLESETPVAVTRRGKTLGVYIPTPKNQVQLAHAEELRAAADRLAVELADMSEEELVSDFKKFRAERKAALR